MFALVLAAWIQTQAQTNFVHDVAACIDDNAYSCSDMRARENDGLIGCFIQLPYDMESIRTEFEKNMRIICPLDPSIRKVSHSWNY